MSICRPLWIPCLLTSLCIFSGCGTGTTSPEDLSDSGDALLDSLLGDVESEIETDLLTLDGDTTSPLDLSAAAIPVATAAAPASLQLSLQKGDRFPLVKTIRQNLVQTSSGAPAKATSELEMHMVIQVDDLNTDATLMNVRYTRIKYAHDVNGQALAYDSDTHQNAVPADILPYAGMVNNGFAFWLGRNNRIQQVVGYQEFLQRCVQNVPLARRQNLLAEIAARFGDDGVANFIDDTIGLLPYDQNAGADAATKVAIGDVWYRERRLMHPMPVHMKSTCRLLSLNEKTAEIDITGRIANADSATAGQSRIQVRDGRSMGSCIVDRATGLPLKLNRSRYLNLTVTGADGQTYEQEKRVETTIQSFPNSQGTVVHRQQQLPVRRGTSMTAAPQTAQLMPTPQQRVTPPALPPNYGIQQVNGLQPRLGVQPVQQAAAVGTPPPRPQVDLSNIRSEVKAVYPE